MIPADIWNRIHAMLHGGPVLTKAEQRRIVRLINARDESIIRIEEEISSLSTGLRYALNTEKSKGLDKA